MPVGHLGHQLDGPAIGRHGLVSQPLTVEGDRQLIMGDRDFFFENDRHLEAGGCLGEAAAAQQCQAEGAVRSGIRRVEAGRLAQGGDGGRQFPGPEQADPLPAKALRRLGLMPRRRCAPGAGRVSCVQTSGGHAVHRLPERFRLAQLARFAQWTKVQPNWSGTARRARGSWRGVRRAAAFFEFTPAAARTGIIAARSGPAHHASSG